MSDTCSKTFPIFLSKPWGLRHVWYTKVRGGIRHGSVTDRAVALELCIGTGAALYTCVLLELNYAWRAPGWGTTFQTRRCRLHIGVSLKSYRLASVVTYTCNLKVFFRFVEVVVSSICGVLHCIIVVFNNFEASLSSVSTCFRLRNRCTDLEIII